ncbi:hypothetical protein RFI_35249, partial [Reticulomyxa filosa]
MTTKKSKVSRELHIAWLGNSFPVTYHFSNSWKHVFKRITTSEQKEDNMAVVTAIEYAAFPMYETDKEVKSNGIEMEEYKVQLWEITEMGYEALTQRMFSEQEKFDFMMIGIECPANATEMEICVEGIIQKLLQIAVCMYDTMTGANRLEEYLSDIQQLFDQKILIVINLEEKDHLDQAHVLRELNVKLQAKLGQFNDNETFKSDGKVIFKLSCIMFLNYEFTYTWLNFLSTTDNGYWQYCLLKNMVDRLKQFCSNIDTLITLCCVCKLLAENGATDKYLKLYYTMLPDQSEFDELKVQLDCLDS